MLLGVACEDQQSEGNHKPDAADAHGAECDPSLALGEAEATLLVLKFNEVSCEMVGG